jgi:hypothetical protein
MFFFFSLKSLHISYDVDINADFDEVKVEVNSEVFDILSVETLFNSSILF